jgi:hypothetical protein
VLHSQLNYLYTCSRRLYLFAAKGRPRAAWWIQEEPIMAYDYDALVAEFQKQRQAAATAAASEDRQERLQAAVQALESLSSHCPMAPLLWIQYAAALADWLTAMGADRGTIVTSQREILALGLAEFPGSLLVQCRHVQASLDDDTLGENDRVAIIEAAIERVGKGSYRKSDALVAWLYRTCANRRRTQGQLDRAWQVFVQQARIPLGTANDALLHTVQTWAGNNEPIPPPVIAAFEHGRRLAAKVYTEQHEDDVEALLHATGILDRVHLEWREETDENVDWASVEQTAGQRYGMGLGDAELAQAFIQYANACARPKPPRKEDAEEEEDNVRTAMETAKCTTLVISLYERAVAECPTVEGAWLAYLGAVQRSNDRSSLPALVQRACRNCPYSVTLVHQDLEISSHLATEGMAVLDPEAMVQRVQKAWDGKFLPGGAATWCDLHLRVAAAVRQRILALVLPGYDTDKKTTDEPRSMSDENKEEIEDLVEDGRELFETMLNGLHERFPKFSQGRAQFLQDQILTDFHLLRPLQLSLGSDKASLSDSQDASSVQALAKAARLHAHPDVYLTWIRFQQFNPAPPHNAVSVVSTLAQIRRSFVQAWQQVSPKASGGRDFATALTALAHEWTRWESLFGSTDSLQRAQSSIERKYRKLQQQNEQKADWSAKRPAEDFSSEVSRKKHKVDYVEVVPPNKVETAPTKEIQPPVQNPVEQNSSAPSTKVPDEKDSAIQSTATEDELPKQSSQKKPKVKIGGMEYPSHPFTVRVSNLGEQVEDMDLVDLLRPKCGAVVHSRIIREKGPGRTKSKGWGLVQFEEQKSVGKALALSEVVGLQEKLVTIERSHMSAVALVPPGWHRVKRKGEGRNSKFNEKKKHDRKPPEDKSMPRAPRPSILSLTPRGVPRVDTRPKPKIAVEKVDPKSNDKANP